MDVEVIKASETPVIRDRRRLGQGVQITRKRVAAYVRVSTDNEEQLQSFQSQKEYYQNLIAKNKDWVLVEIYADEAITGTKTEKRDGFLKMINDGVNGLIDIVLTKSISRFSRNLVDTLHYVRLLKEKGVTVIFEKENINTSTMESEMQLALLSTLAQNEVESLSSNVKLGLKMKMRRGEMMGFNGCLGYDYHPEDKTLTINEQEADTVRLIYDMYLDGYGSDTIAKELTRSGRKNKKGEVKWTTSGIRVILKNEKYKGDLLMGKTYTVDPISKRRLENRGEEEKYYVHDHHEAIISKEVWEKAQEIRKGRFHSNPTCVDGVRARYTKKYAFSSICQCGFCGTNMVRRSHHQDTQHKKPAWKCQKAIKDGIASCPESKSIDEAVLEHAFLESFQLLADHYDDVLDAVLNALESTLSSNDGLEKVKKLTKEIEALQGKRKKLTDMYLDDKITEDVYEEQCRNLERKLNKKNNEREFFSESAASQKNVQNRMKEIRSKLEQTDSIEIFDRSVFESIVEKVIVGGIGQDGVVDPYRVTFVLKGMDDQVIEEARTKYKKHIKCNQ